MRLKKQDLCGCLGALVLLQGQALWAQQPDWRPPRPPEGQEGFRPPPPPRDQPPAQRRNDRPPPQAGGQRYSLEQALSDQAQLHTIAFSGLAFLTGDFAYDSFLPPGKVSDYFGFQYMRDTDRAGKGHSTAFLTRIAYNMLAILDDAQRGKLIQLANAQESDIRRFAEMRFPLMQAFRWNLEAKAGGLDRQKVMDASAALYALDGELAYQRAQVMADVLRSLNSTQKAALARLRFADFSSWPEVLEPLDRRSMSHEVNVAVMTYASEMFSWQAGSLTADVYFCPERHGMYFGGFGMKTAPAMGKQNYAISTSLTGDSGEAFLALLTPSQRQQLTRLPEIQQQALQEIVSVRRSIATELRRLLKGEKAERAQVIALSRRYGELDGGLSHDYATAFARIRRTLTDEQFRQLQRLRQNNPNDPKGPFLYSTPIAMPRIQGAKAFLTAR
jgi:Spy/CpxP family protein refolding chaperone